MIPRTIQTSINAYLNGNKQKIFFIWGPRRSGKTTLLKQISESLDVPLFNFDLFSDHEKFAPDKQILQKIASACPVILIDEVQNYPQSTLALKILADEFDVKIIATGSSELKQKSKQFDSLAGRFTEHYCLPLSFEEIRNHIAPKAYEEKQFSDALLNEIQCFGSYPEVYTTENEFQKIEYLQNIIDTYLLKDIVTIYNLQNAKLAKDILIKIALQIGCEVSLREIATTAGANATTVANIIEIFIKNHILIPLPSFKTNLRRAISQHRKYYFMDLGLRNALIKDFRPLNLRPDAGNVFENLIVAEIHKRLRNHQLLYTMYFYREYGGKEIDLILENYEKKYLFFEIKKQHGNANPIFPLSHKSTIINSGNFFEIIKNIN